MRNISIFLVLIFLVFTSSNAQDISLDYCREQAISKSPLQKKKLYFDTKRELETKALDANYYPNMFFDGKASYQSDVVTLEFPFPGAVSPDIPKDQYRIHFNVNQMIWDGGITSRNEDVVLADNEANRSSVDVSLFSIKDIINGLYFKILFVQQSLKILEVSEKQLDTNRHIIESYVKNGVMYKSNLESISIKILRIQQNIKDLKANRKSLVEMLSKWIEEPLDENVVLKLPVVQSSDFDRIIRPEYDLFESRQKLLDANMKLISTKLVPKIFAFGMGGYGIPNQFNFFDAKGSFYWIAGLNFQWTPFDWNSTSNKKQSLEISKSIIEAERENFDKNLNISLIKEKTDIDKLAEIIEVDNEIIERQKKIVDEYFSRLQNNTITVTDYLLQVNELIKTNLELKLHNLQKLSAEVNLLTKTGNY